MKILLADDHPLVRDGTRLLLTELSPDAEVIEAGSFPEVLEKVRVHDDFTLILLDRSMPGTQGNEAVEALRALVPNCPIVVLSASEDPNHVWKALDQGARGYIPKSSKQDVLIGALRLVLSGGTYLPPTLLDRAGVNSVNENAGEALGLTRRQSDVLDLLIQGKTNKQIAKALDISDATIRTHVAAIFKTLDVNTRTEAVHVAAGRGYESDSQS